VVDRRLVQDAKQLHHRGAIIRGDPGHGDILDIGRGRGEPVQQLSALKAAPGFSDRHLDQPAPGVGHVRQRVDTFKTIQKYLLDDIVHARWVAGEPQGHAGHIGGVAVIDAVEIQGRRSRRGGLWADGVFVVQAFPVDGFDHLSFLNVASRLYFLYGDISLKQLIVSVFFFATTLFFEPVSGFPTN
jgi:hypothetical protein